MSMTIFAMLKSNLFQSINELHLQRQTEAGLIADMMIAKARVSDLESQIDLRTKAVVGEAYQDKVITGSNANVRKAQEGKVITNDAMINSLYKELSEAQEDYAEKTRLMEIAKAERQHKEDVKFAWMALCRASRFEIEEELVEEE